MMLRPHASALVAALLFALLVAGPFILSGFATNFADPYPELTNDQSFYLARIQDIRDGYPVTGNAYLAEHKNALPMQFLTGEYLEALILDLLSLPTSASLILFTLFFTPIIFLSPTRSSLCSRHRGTGAYSLRFCSLSAYISSTLRGR